MEERIEKGWKIEREFKRSEKSVGEEYMGGWGLGRYETREGKW